MKEISNINLNNNHTINDLISNKLKLLRDKLIVLDENNSQIRSSLDTWTYILKCNMQSVNYEPNENRKKHRHKYNFIDCIENEKLLECLTPQMNGNNNSNLLPNAKSIFINTWIILIHSTIFIINSYIVYPTNYQFITTLEYPSYITGIVLAMTPLSSFLIVPLFINNLSFRYYKITLIMSIFILLISNLAYIYSYFFKSLLLMILSRLLLGIGGLKILASRYITEEIPSDMIIFYSKIEYFIVWLGYALSIFLFFYY